MQEPPDFASLKTQRLTLRPPRLGDAQQFFSLASDPSVTEFLAWEPHKSLQDSTNTIEALIAAQRAKQGFHWFVFLGEELAGLVSLIDVRWTHRSWTINRAELAYWIGAEYQGNGLATEAARAVIRFAFRDLQLRKLRVYHAAANSASKRTIEKLAFRYVGEERSAFEKAGRIHDLKHYELLRTDIEAC